MIDDLLEQRYLDVLYLCFKCIMPFQASWMNVITAGWYQMQHKLTRTRMVLVMHVTTVLETTIQTRYDSMSINIWFTIRTLNNYLLHAEGLSKGKQNTQNTNLSCYVPKSNMDHTISGQGTAINTLDHSATTPRFNVKVRPLQDLPNLVLFCCFVDF